MNYKGIILILLLICGLFIAPISAIEANYLDQYKPYHVLHITGNGTDGSTTFSDMAAGKTITVLSNTTVNTTSKIFGSGSARFGGVESGLQVGPSDDFNLTGNFTVVMWAYTPLNGSASNLLLSVEQGSTGFAPLVVFGSNGQYKIYSSKSGSAWDVANNYVFGNNYNTTWQQIYVSGNITNQSLVGCINGVCNVINPSYSGLFSANEDVRIGRDYSGTRLSGNIDELNFWKGVSIPISTIYPQKYEIQSSIAGITANFSTSTTSGTQPLIVQFTDTSTTTDATIDSWAWDFGEGNTSALQSPDHTYEIPGTYQVNLTITNTSYSLVSTKLATITVYNLTICDFASFNTAGTAPFTTYLYDTSTDTNPDPFTYSWDLGDGNTSTSQNLYYTWNLTGTYDVKHSITDNIATTWCNKTGYVTAGTAVVAPVASFYGGPQTGNVPLTVSFTDVSSNTPTSWFWEFGDGTNSTLQNPSHAYTRSGFRTVNLTATNSAGANITVRSKFVRVN